MMLRATVTQSVFCAEGDVRSPVAADTGAERIRAVINQTAMIPTKPATGTHGRRRNRATSSRGLNRMATNDATEATIVGMTAAPALTKIGTTPSAPHASVVTKGSL